MKDCQIIADVGFSIYALYVLEVCYLAPARLSNTTLVVRCISRPFDVATQYY